MICPRVMMGGAHDLVGPQLCELDDLSDPLAGGAAGGEGGELGRRATLSVAGNEFVLVGRSVGLFSPLGPRTQAFELLVTAVLLVTFVTTPLALGFARLEDAMVEVRARVCARSETQTPPRLNVRVGGEGRGSRSSAALARDQRSETKHTSLT